MLTRWVVLSFIGAIVCAFLLWIVLVADRPDLQSMPDTTQSHALHREIRLLEGFTHSEPDEYGAATIVEADQLVFRPKRIGFFNVKYINEIYIENVKHKVNIPSSGRYDLNPFSFVKNIIEIHYGSGDSEDLAMRRVFKTIAQQTIENFDLEMLVGGVQKLHVNAQKVSLDANSSSPVYQGVTVSEFNSDKKIFCKEMVWDSLNKNFKVQGAYLLIDRNSQKSGSDVILDLDFSIAHKS